MDKVYSLKDFSRLNEVTKEFLKDFPDPVVKLHFGEPGNKTAFTPKDVEPIITALDNPTMLDTPVVYASPRNNVKDYQKVVKERGYDKLAKFIISDTYKKFKMKDLTAEISRELLDADNVLVLTHVKGHACSGFGGAIKNLGMGANSPKSKGTQHAGAHPRWKKECQGCGTCARSCPADAIEMVDDKAKIDQDCCWGCSICVVVCPFDCLAPKVALFDDLLAQAASAAINNMKNVFYINVIKNVSKKCDCAVDSEGIVSEDIGILFSKNPVAIDQASIDLINKLNGKNLFKEVNHKDPQLQIDFAEKYTKYKKKYELVEN